MLDPVTPWGGPGTAVANWYWPGYGDSPAGLVGSANEYTGMPGDWRGFPGDEGIGSFFFWPPVRTARISMRVAVRTLWEAAWAEIVLPY